MKLYAKNGERILIGQRVKTLSGEQAVVLAMYQPNHPNSIGRILLRFDDGDAEYYPDVIGAQWRNM